MIKCASYDVVFREIPNEVTLALNLSLCPNRCLGCHSPNLREDIGEIVDETLLTNLINQYGKAITCLCFMGGDNDPLLLSQLAHFIKQNFAHLKVGWYSGRSKRPERFEDADFDYIKLGPYKKELGPLDKSTTNQRLYEKQVDKSWKDITSQFWVLPSFL